MSGHRGPGSLTVKVTDSWLACHEFEPGSSEDLPCRRGRCTLNMSWLVRPPVGIAWKYGEGASQVSSSSLDHGSKLRGPSAT
ncbi:hypothetical protein TNCV_5094591 [Trichonephila clavipes]|nr:hypothetical protein TNCV_5094591 [Trichonephila clavipes]